MAKETKSSQPKEAEVMAYILKEMGISEYEPGVINQMLEFTYRYVTQILDEARAYANYAKKSKTIEIDDVKLAIHMQVEKSVTTPPPRDLLLELSRTRNANPLPTIKPQCGIRLPPDRYCLSACNMQLKSSFRKSKGGNASGSSRGNMMGSGAKSGNNPLKPSISMMTTKTGNSQTVTLVQKSSSTVSASPSPKVVSVNRPLIKVTPGPPGVGSPKIHISAGSNIGGLKVGGIKTEDLSSKRKRDEDDDDYDV